MAMAEGEMRGCTDERQRERERGKERKRKVLWVGELEDREMLYITYCHMFSNGITAQDRREGCVQKSFALSQCFD